LNLTEGFETTSNGSKPQAATFDKWMFPSARNLPADKDRPFLVNNTLFLSKVKLKMLIILSELYLIYMLLKQSENRSEVICKRFILTNRNGKSSIVYPSILLK